jgi:acyl-ACP thioesterase
MKDRFTAMSKCMGENASTYEIRWSDLDANGHVNYAAYNINFRYSNSIPKLSLDLIGL